MMIATLNEMPKEPAQHMKDYINLHYFFEQSRKKTNIDVAQTDTERER